MKDHSDASKIWNTRYFEQAEAARAQGGIPLSVEVWQHLSPFQWTHIHLNGSYHFTDVALEGDSRPLLEYHGPRTRVSPGSERAESGAIPVQEEEELIPIQLSLLDEEDNDR